MVIIIGHTGSGIRSAFRSSTCTVVGNCNTANHSPFFVPRPPPTWVKDQSCVKDLVVLIVMVEVAVKEGLVIYDAATLNLATWGQSR
jgi:hypothetical protein